MAFRPGCCCSPSTRRQGLVANTDFAPTVGGVLRHQAGRFPRTAVRRAWRVVRRPVKGATGAHALEEQAVRQARGMKVLPYLRSRARPLDAARDSAGLDGRGLPRFWPVVPLRSGRRASVQHRPIISWCSGLLLFLALAGLLAARSAGTSCLLLLLAILDRAVMVLDMLTGSRLMQPELLGYSAIEGARYYGIGNEAMGALIGALLVLTARLWRRLDAWTWAGCCCCWGSSPCCWFGEQARRPEGCLFPWLPLGPSALSCSAAGGPCALR